jgi:hypothetical protein
MPDYKDNLGYKSSEMQAIYTGTSPEPVITVDQVTRSMEVDPAHNIAGVVGDHNSNPVRFRIHRFVDGGDLMTCNEFYVAWQNPEAETQGYTAIDDVRVDPAAPQEYILATWLVDHLTCANAGQIEIMFRAVQSDSEGFVQYEWQTLLNDEMKVLPGINTAYGDVDDSGGTFTIDEEELETMLEEVLISV